MIYWRLSLPQIVKIVPDLLELFENISGVRFFSETQCIYAYAYNAYACGDRNYDQGRI